MKITRSSESLSKGDESKETYVSFSTEGTNDTAVHDDYKTIHYLHSLGSAMSAAANQKRYCCPEGDRAVTSSTIVLQGNHCHRLLIGSIWCSSPADMAHRALHPTASHFT